MSMPWLDGLKQFVEKKPIVVLRFDESDWDALRDSRRGANEFTIARPHAYFNDVKVPTACLVHGGGESGERLYFGMILSRGAVTTLDTRIKVARARHVSPGTLAGLFELVNKSPHRGNLRKRLKGNAPVVRLSPELSIQLVERLASIDENHRAMRSVAEALLAPKTYESNAALQEDAVNSALTAFGRDAIPASLELVSGRETALANVRIREDAVIENDARQISGYEFMGGDLTGRAVFERGLDRLEVITANRGKLENCFGVDLIYWNATRQSIVMLQYKMLEPAGGDWVYRPDLKLDDQIKRMHSFTSDQREDKHEYRLNSSVFYLKFVRRDGAVGASSVITPLEHFEKLRHDPRSKGPKGGFRVSFESLNGRYLRQGVFLELVRSGYIGSHAETTRQLKTLVDEVLNDNRAVIAAIQNTVAVDDTE